MITRSEKLDLLKMILATENQHILTAIKKILMKETPVDFYDALSKEQKIEIELSLEEIERGDIVSYEDLMTRHRS